jgi:hypothetical protein
MFEPRAIYAICSCCWLGPASPLELGRAAVEADASEGIEEAARVSGVAVSVCTGRGGRVFDDEACAGRVVYEVRVRVMDILGSAKGKADGFRIVIATLVSSRRSSKWSR